jgi:3-dehydroquinate synthase
MSKEFTFDFEGRKFKVPQTALAASTFEVQSSPKPYLVSTSIASNPFSEIEELLSQNPNNVLLIDKKVYELYKANSIIDSNRVFLAEASEEFKTLDGAIKVIDFLCDRGFTKGETLIVVGGGIIQDVGAFVGACYKRGIKWILFPTTLLSMCDSCIGGKSGINYRNAKNQIALFSAPYKVIININFLKTLEQFHLQSGLGEILKLLVLGGKDFFNTYLKNVNNGKLRDFNNYFELILASLNVKKAVIEVDEFEFNYRKSLNYGHTFGHAIEALSSYQIPHGLAVVIGMMLVNELSCTNNVLNVDENDIISQQCRDLLTDDIMNIMANIDLAKLIALLKKDKKTKGSILNLVFLEKIGKTIGYESDLNGKFKDNVNEILKKLF